MLDWHRSRKGMSRALLVMAAASYCLCALAQEPAAPQENSVAAPVENRQIGAKPYRQHYEREGIAVEVAIDHVDPVNKVPGFFSEGDRVRVSFKISDTATGKPLKGAYPAAWLDLVAPDQKPSATDCTEKLKAFLGGGLFGTPEINLNEYYVVALNKDNTLTVVDPVFGFGGTKLLAMIDLDGPGGDWAQRSDQSTIYVSIPAADQITVVDTASWQVRAKIPTGPRPVRTLLQPDETYLWSAYRGSAPKGPASGEGGPADVPGGVAVFHTKTLKEVARFSTGDGAHDLTFDQQNRYAFIANELGGTVTVVDIAALKVVAEIPTGREPVSLDYSALAQAVYVAHRDGTVAVIDAASPALVKRIKADAGLGQIRFEPKGRYAFLLNSVRDDLYVIDATKQRIVQNGDMLREPDKVAFSDSIAYISHRGSETVLMVTLADVGVEGRMLTAVDFPGGQYPPGRTELPTPADTIVQAPGASAVLVANGPDKSIYFYKEGMAAPMGHFANYSHEPRALLVVDRSLKEHHQPGLYETFVSLDTPGLYDMVFFMDAPRANFCVGFAVAPDPARQAQRDQKKVAVRFKEKHLIAPMGKQVGVDFTILDLVSGKTREDLKDVMVLVNLQPGIWHKRYHATHQGDGVYRIAFTPPRKGLYRIYASSRSAALDFGNGDYLVLRAGPPIRPNVQRETTEKTSQSSGGQQ